MNRSLAFTIAVCSASLLLALAPAPAVEVDSAVRKAEDQRIAAMQKAGTTVLAVFASNGGGGGSGVVISPDGFALTNFHVVKPCGNAMKCGMADGKVYDAVLVGIDPTGDVAMIKLFGRDDFPTAELGDSDQVQVGDWVFAMGNPFLLATDFKPTVTYGIVSGTHRYQFPAGTLLEYADCIQTDASINPGNSGGPLFDAEGRLIGINGRGSFEKRGRVNVGVGYAISINQIKNFLGYLHSGRIVDHATLGATVAFDEDGRVVVENILEDCDAYRRGLRYDDEVVSFGGRAISTPNGFKNVLGIFPKGWRVPLGFVRDGKRYNVMVRLVGVHGTEELIEKTEGREQRPIDIPMPKPEPKKDGESEEKQKEKDWKPGEKPAEGEKAKPAEEPKAEPKKDEAAKPAGEPKKDDAKPADTAKEQPAKQPELKKGDEPKKDAEPKKETEPAKGTEPEKAPEKEKTPKEKPRIQQHQIPMPNDPHHPRVRPSPPPMPEVARKHFEKKRGYANYYFNKQNRDRVWKAWTALVDFAPLGGDWTITGKRDTGTQFKLVLTDKTVALSLPTKDYNWTLSDELGTSLEPPASGGMLPALHLLRRLALLGPDKFGEVYYLGTVPVQGRTDLADVLVGVHAGIECRFLFDRANGHMLGLEFYPEDHVDPCEIAFSDYRQIDGRPLPGQMEVRCGDTLFGVFKFEQFDLVPGTTTLEQWTPENAEAAKKAGDAEKKDAEKKEPEKKEEAPPEPEPGEAEPETPEKTAEK